MFSACLTRNYEVIEFLLQRGANPNCISYPESLLDWVEWDHWFEKNERSDWADEYLPIIELLKKFGAKSYRELMGDDENNSNQITK